MGSQADIHVIYGVKVKAEVVKQPMANGKPIDGLPVLYSVNGKTLSHDEDYHDEADIEAGVKYSTGKGKKKKHHLSVRALGHDNTDMEMGARHFDGKVLLGYLVGSSYYINDAGECLSPEKMLELKDQLKADVKSTFGINVKDGQIKPYVLLEYINGY